MSRSAQPRRIIQAATVLLLACGLSACLLDRVQNVQEQTCNPEEHFQLSIDNGLELEFLDPVLRYEDIVFLVGIAPQPGPQPGKDQQAFYTLRIEGSGEPEPTQIELEFFEKEDKSLLRSVGVNLALSLVFSREELLLMAKQNCSTELPGWGTQFERPIPDYILSMLPDRSQVIAFAGQPTKLSVDGRELHYHFVLEGAQLESLNGSVQMRFDESGALLRVRSKFSHFVSVSDFERGVEWLTLSL